VLRAGDADQGLSHKIFSFHVPIALTACGCFGWWAWKALRAGKRIALRLRELKELCA
jgi:hypothetical protein